MLISIDGIDGCGKSTQVKRLAQMLNATQLQEISDSRWGRTLRALESPTLEQQMAYFLADRTQLAPTLEAAAGSETNHIVSDRSYLSSLGYQSYDSVFTPGMLEGINRSLVPEYDLMLVLDLDVDIALQRVKARGEKLTWCENPGLLTWARRVFQTWAAQRDNIYLVNAEQSMDEVTADIKAIAEKVSRDKFNRLVW